MPTAQTVIAQGNALGMQNPIARLPRRDNMIDAYVWPVGALGLFLDGSILSNSFLNQYLGH